MRGEPVDKAGEFRDRIVGLVRIGDMALNAGDLHLEAERAPASDLDRIAEPVGRCRLADETVIGYVALFLHPGENLFGAVDGRPLLIGGDEQRERARKGALLHGIASSGDKGSDRTLHVGGAAAEEKAVLLMRRKRRRRPVFQPPWRDDIDMAGKA